MIVLHPTGRCKQHSGGSGGGGGGGAAPLISRDQTEAQRAEKNVLEAAPHLSQHLDDNFSGSR